MAAVPLEAAIGELGAKRAAEGGLTVDCVLATIGPGFTSLLDLLPSTDTPAVIPVDARAPARMRGCGGSSRRSARSSGGTTSAVVIVSPFCCPTAPSSPSPLSRFSRTAHARAAQSGQHAAGDHG